jgi:predicted RNase H-like nuclease (RuvC/YqgF family)
MGIFEGLEKIINEHGSATILRERLALAREQHEAQIGALESAREKLTAEREVLSAQLKDAQAEIQRLKKQVASLRPEAGLSEEEVGILKMLASQDCELTAQLIAQASGSNITRVEFFLRKLEDGRFIDGRHYYTGQASSYQIAHGGRGYLMHRGLV